MFQQHNTNSIFQIISIPIAATGMNSVNDKGPKLSQTQTFLDQKDLATEQSLDRVTVKHSVSQSIHDASSPYKNQQFNIYQEQQGGNQIKQDQAPALLSSGPVVSSDYFKQSIPLNANGYGRHPSILNLGSDCFVENIQRSIPLSGGQASQLSSQVQNISILPVHQIRQVSPINQNQPHSIQRSLPPSNISPGIQMKQMNMVYDPNYPRSQGTSPMNAKTQDYNNNMLQSFGQPPANVNLQNQQQQQFQQPSSGLVGFQSCDVQVTVPTENSRQDSPIKQYNQLLMLQQQQQQQQQALLQQHQQQNLQNNQNQIQQNGLPKHELIYSHVVSNKSSENTTNSITSNSNQTNTIVTTSQFQYKNNNEAFPYQNTNTQPSINSANSVNQYTMPTNQQLINYNSQNNQINNCMNSGDPINQYNIPTNQYLLISPNQQQTIQNSQNIQMNNQQPIQNINVTNKDNKLHVHSFSNALNGKLNGLQQQQQYTITFGSSNNLNTNQSNNNNSSTLYQLLQPYQISNQSNNSQANEFSNGSSKELIQLDPSQIYRNQQSRQISPFSQTTPNLNIDFNSILIGNNQNQLSQFPQHVVPFQQPQDINQAQVQSNSQNFGQQLRNDHIIETNKQSFQKSQQPQSYPVSAQRRGSHSQYVSPKDSNSTAQTSPIDIQVKQNKHCPNMYGDSNHTTNRICEVSTTMNPLFIPSENVSSREENGQQQNQQFNNSSFQKPERYLSQHIKTKSDIPPSDSSSSLLQYQANSQTIQTGTQLGPSNGSLHSIQSSVGVQQIGQIKDENQAMKNPILITPNSNNMINSNQNDSNGQNQQFYYYKTNKQSKDNLNKQPRKANQSYDRVSTYYQRIKQFNESSKEDKIEMCQSGTLKQYLSNSRRNSILNKTDKSLDASLNSSNYNSTKTKSNTQSGNTSSQVPPQDNSSSNQFTFQNIDSKAQEQNFEQPKKSGKPQQIISDKQSQEIGANSQNKDKTEEKIGLLLSPSSHKQIQKIQESKREDETQQGKEIQEVSFDNSCNITQGQQNTQQVPNYPKFIQRVNSIKEIKKVSPAKQMNTLLNSYNNNQGQLNYSEYPSYSPQNNNNNNPPQVNLLINPTTGQPFSSNCAQSYDCNFITKPTLDPNFQVNPYEVADKYLEPKETQNSQQFAKPFMESMQQQKQQIQQQQDIQQLQQSSKHKINNIDIVITATNTKKNRYTQNQVLSQQSDRFNTFENDPIQNCSFKPESFQNNQFFQQPNEQSLLSIQQVNNSNQTYAPPVEKQKKGKSINTIYIDMSEISQKNPSNNQSQNLNNNSDQYYQQTPNLDLYQSANQKDQYYTQFRQYNNYQKEPDFNENQDQYKYNTPQSDYKNIMVVQQDEERITSSELQDKNSNLQYQSPLKKQTNKVRENEIIIFDTQFHTQEEELPKSAQNLNQRNFSTLQGMNMVTLESQQGGYENVQRFQYSPQVFNTEQANYNLNTDQNYTDKKTPSNQQNLYSQPHSPENKMNKNNNSSAQYQNEVENLTPDESYYNLQDSPQILNKQIRPTIVPQLNLQKSYQQTLTTLNQNTSFNISQSPTSQHTNAQQNQKNQISYLTNPAQSRPNSNSKQKETKEPNEKLVQNNTNSKENQVKAVEKKNSFKRHASFSNINVNYFSNQTLLLSKQSTPVHRQYYLSPTLTQPSSLKDSAILSSTSHVQKPKFNRTSNVTQWQQRNSNSLEKKEVKRNKSQGSITYQSEEMGQEMHLTRKIKNELGNHLQILENRIQHLKREEESIKKRANSTKKQAETIKKVQMRVQEEHHNQHLITEAQKKKYVETQKGRIHNLKQDHQQKIKRVQDQNQQIKQELARSVKFNSHMNKSVVDENKQNYQQKTNEQKNKVKQQQLRFQEQRHLQQLYNQTSQMQQFLLKIKDEKVKKEEIEQKILSLEQVEQQLVQKLQQTYESNKQYIRTSNHQSQMSLLQSNILQEQPQQQQRKDILLTTTENFNTNTSFTVFNQY